MRLLVLLTLLLSLTGCSVYYTSPICQPNIRTDVPFFSGNYRFYLYDQEFNMMTAGYKLTQVGTGTYKGEPRGQPPEEPIVYTCQIGTRTIMESESKRTDGTRIGWSAYMIKDFNDGISITPIIFDTTQLGAAGVPFTLIPKEECNSNTTSQIQRFGAQKFSSKINALMSGDKCLMVDNSGIDSDKFSLMIYPFSLSLNLYR